MTRRCRFAAVLLCCAAASAALAQSGAERVIRRSTSAGREVRIFTYTQHRSDCSPAEPPKIVVQTSPVHGIVSIRPDSVESGAPRFGGIDCSGRIVPGNGIWYIPQPGYRGTDQFDYTVQNDNGRAHDTAVIEVR